MKKIIFSVIAFIFILTSCKEDNALLTKEEIDEIAIPLIEESLKVYDKAMGLFLDIEEESVVENGVSYYKVKNIHSKNELWNLVNTVYTSDAGKRIFTDNIEGSKRYKPKFVEKEGSLYKARTIPLVGSDSYPLKSVAVLEQNDDSFCVLADFYYTFAKLHFTKTDTGWRIENSVHEGEKEYTDNVEYDSVYSVLKLIEKDTLMIDVSKTVDFISEDEAKKIFLPLFERSYNIYHNYIKNALQFNMGDFTGNFENEKAKHFYYYVEFPELKTLSDVWESAYGAYTKASAKRLFHHYLDKNNNEARYVEKGGALYCQVYGHGNMVEYDMSSLRLIEQYENALVFTLDEYVMGDFETKRVFVLEKSVLGWRMSNGFDETVLLSDERYEGVDFAESSEGKFLAYASKNQNIFPINFQNGTQAVTVNAPIFTGIKTENAYTYKNYFAFEKSQVVIPVLAKYNDKKNVTRYILLDKSANVLDDSFSKSSVVKNKEAISKYPNGIEVIQMGEPGAYSQYLATIDGERLSDSFDEIGFFYNGIAIVRKENKIGFISVDGTTLFEPFIEIDDLRYTPDYTRGFQVKYMTDDAFVVSIGGELAIITLDRFTDAEQYIMTLPFDFSYEPYTAPEITTSDKFIWGDYMPFVVYTKDNRDDPIPVFALLGEGVTTLDEGHKVYEKLNSLYLTSYPIPEGDYGGIDYSEERVADYLFSSSIINMSTDLERMGIWRVVDFENSKSELDLYINGECVDTIHYDTWYHTNARVKSMDPNIFFDGVQAVYSYDHIEKKESYSVYKKSQLLYEVIVELKERYNVVLNQMIDENHLLITFVNHSDTPITSDPDDNGISRNTYIFSVEENSVKKVENYVANPLLSPDGKYLIYSSFQDRNASANPPDNWAYKMEEGFYVKNLENGQTVFYPFDCDWNPAHDAICWISKDAYYKAIN